MLKKNLEYLGSSNNKCTCLSFDAPSLHKSDDTKICHQIEKRQLPKRIRQEMKARELMFRESMRISTSHLPDSHDDEKNKLRKVRRSCDNL